MALEIDSKVSGDLIAVGATPQADATTAATLDKLLLFDENSGITQNRSAETNEADKTGQNEATDVNQGAISAEGTLSMAKATPDGIAWMARMALGSPTTTALGTGYRHVFKLNAYPDHPAYFTAAHRKGGSGALAPAEFQRYRGMGIGSVELNAQKDEFLELVMNTVGLGFVDDAVFTEVVTGVDLTAGGTFVIANDVAGADDAARLTKIMAVADDDGDGIYETVLDLTAYVQATNTATFADPSGSNATAAVKVTYHLDPGVSGQAWQDEVTGLATADEFLLKATNMRIVLAAGIDAAGAAPVRIGGQVAECEVESFSWQLERNAEAGSCWRTTENASDDYAQAVELGDVQQRITVDRRVKDWLMKQAHDSNDPIGIEINAVGPEFASAEGNYYEVRLFFPYCKILTKTLGPADGKWQDSLEIAVLKAPADWPDNGDDQPTCTIVVQNKIASY